jgi:hypothetical protein
MGLFLYLISIYANFIITHASEPVKILGRNFDTVEINNIIYSDKCAKECMAKTAVEKYLQKPFPLKSKVGFYSQEGSVLCRDYWNEVSLLGIKNDKSPTAFCLFKDQSFVEIQSLSKRVQNDKK